MSNQNEFSPKVLRWFALNCLCWLMRGILKQGDMKQMRKRTPTIKAVLIEVISTSSIQRYCLKLLLLYAVACNSFLPNSGLWCSVHISPENAQSVGWKIVLNRMQWEYEIIMHNIALLKYSFNKDRATKTWKSSTKWIHYFEHFLLAMEDNFQPHHLKVLLYLNGGETSINHTGSKFNGNSRRQTR